MWKCLWGEQAVHTPQVKVQIPLSAEVCFHLTVAASHFPVQGENGAVCCRVEITGPKCHVFIFIRVRGAFCSVAGILPTYKWSQ